MLRYTSRRGVTWYLHQGTTKTGKPKYFVSKSVRPGALTALPDGFEFAENVNGVVSVRRVDPSQGPVTELHAQMVRSEVARHPHLRHHRVEASKGEIVIYEPAGAMSEAELHASALVHDIPPGLYEQRMADHWARGRFAPVLRFRPVSDTPDEFFAQRMTYRGKGGWSSPLQHGSLAVLLGHWLPLVGTEGLFQQY